MQIVSKETKTIPGPGYYESPTRIGSGPKVQIHAKLNDISRNVNPGPAYYNPTEVLVRERSPKYTIDPSTERMKAVS
jgi:Sperm-tail PG-rich repeat